MSLSAEAIDRIVANVLSQISAPAAVVSAVEAKLVQKETPIAVQQKSLSGKVIVASDIELLPVRSQIFVSAKAIVTPAAWDSIRSRQIEVQRGIPATATAESTAQSVSKAGTAPAPALQPLLIIVRNTKSVDQLWETLGSSWKRELLGCPDDAAKLAISELTRGGVSSVVILTGQTYRAACLANRNEKVKAVPVQEAADVKLVRQQIRANVWCIDPDSRSFFEMKNLFQQIQNEPKK